MPFPAERPRRLRRTPTLREMVRETRLTPSQLVLPLFVRSGVGEKRPIATMPGVFQASVDVVVAQAREAWSLGVPSVLLFGIPEAKDALGSSGWDADGPVPRAVAALLSLGVEEPSRELLVKRHGRATTAPLARGPGARRPRAGATPRGGPSSRPCSTSRAMGGRAW